MALKPGFGRRLRRELLYVVVLGAPVLLFFLVAMPRANAVRFLHGLNAVEVGQSAFNPVEAMASRYGSYAACVGDNCLFQFQNTWLHRLHLAPLTVFSVMLHRRGLASDPGGGQVGTMDMAMLVNQDAGDGGVVASAQDFERSADLGIAPYDASVVFGADGRPGRTIVLLSSAAKPGQRARARAFNLQCLTRLGGCHTSRELLPQVWRDAHHVDAVALHPPSHGASALLASLQMR